MLIGALLSIGIAARIMLWMQYGLEEGNAVQGYYPHIYYATLCRFDEFLPGVGIAMLKHFHRPLWVWLCERANILLLLGLTTTASMFYAAFHFYYIEGYGYGFFMTAFGYSLIAMNFSLLVMAALGKNSWLQRLRIPGARHLALWSYSIYLTHKPIFYILQRNLPGASPAVLMMAIVVVVILVGFVLYRWVERPFIQMRQRYFPDNFHSNVAPLAADLSISKS
jgi:peptidoglycan/LPS O-acetylase OafA/YrhL